MDILTRFSHSVDCDIRLNHGSILNAIWSWVGIEDELRHNVAKVWLYVFYLHMHDKVI